MLAWIEEADADKGEKARARLTPAIAKPDAWRHHQGE